METFQGYQFEPVTQQDVDQLTWIMKRSFDEDTRRHLGLEAGGPPGYDDGSFIRRWFFHPGATPFKVSRDGRLIGALNLFLNDRRVSNLGCMFVDPDCQDRGVGTIIWRFAEHCSPETKVWRTDTPGFSKRNHNFYVNKCGFHVVRIDNPKDPMAESYVLEKVMRP